MPPRSLLLPLLALALIGGALSGCGQTGPLHLPEDAPARENYLIGKKKPKAAAESDAPAANTATPDALEAPAPAASPAETVPPASIP